MPLFLSEWQPAAGVCCCGDVVKFGDMACTLGCECCCFMWDAEQLSDMEVLYTVCGLELKQQAGEGRLGASQLASEALPERVFITQ